VDRVQTFPIWLNAAPLGSFEKLHYLLDLEKVHKCVGDSAPRDWSTGLFNWARDRWAFGGFWDKTPHLLDDEYFQSLNTINPAEKEICYGP